MLTTRWQPLGMVRPEMNRLQEEIEHRLGRLVMYDPRRLTHSAYPPLNLWEDDDNLYFEAELLELETARSLENQLDFRGFTEFS